MFPQGRVLTGLSPNSENFAILPPHFDPADIIGLSVKDWCSVYSDYKNLPDSFQGVIPYLVASLFYHEQYLRQALHPSHPLFLSAVYQCRNPKIIRLRDKVHCQVNEMATGLVATGVPQTLHLSVRVGKLESVLHSSCTAINEALLDLRTDIPRGVSEYLLNHSQVQGSEVQRVYK